MKTIWHKITSKLLPSGRRGGFLIITELMLIVTIMVIGMIVGLVTIRNTMNTELEDFSHSIGGLNQSYAFAGIRSENGSASTGGSLFIDAPDDNAHDNGVWVFVPVSAHEGVAP